MQPMVPASPRRGATALGADQHRHTGQGFVQHSPPPPRSSATPPDAHAHQLRPGGSFAMPLSPAQVQQQHPVRFPGGGGDAAATPGVANWSFRDFPMPTSGATRLDHLSSPANTGGVISRMPSLGTAEFAHAVAPPPPNRVSTSTEPDHRHHQHQQQQQQRTPLTSPTAAAAGGSVASGGFAAARTHRPHAPSAAVASHPHVSPPSPHAHATPRAVRL
jgi:hypothetical protein